MKRVLCPKCEAYNTFDETNYEEGQSLVFVCEHCSKQFTVRMGKSLIRSQVRKETFEEERIEGVGYISVIENVFGYKQVFPLQLGANIIGRKSKGSEVQCSIDTGDTSMGRKHCVIIVKQDKEGLYSFVIKDFPSVTGTFLHNDCLRKNEQVRIEEGAVITIGATTFILYEGVKE